MAYILLTESDYDMNVYLDWLGQYGQVEVLGTLVQDQDEVNNLIASNEARFRNAQFIVFSGGSDIDPKYFNIDLQEDELDRYKIKLPNNRRDFIEDQYFRLARKYSLPVLGICRGIQFINCLMGGSLCFDLGSETDCMKHTEYPDRSSFYHEIIPERDSWLMRLLEIHENQYVASRHHQAVKNIAPGLKLAARSPDGIIEFLESKKSQDKIALMQFHPEFMYKENRNSELADRIGRLFCNSRI